MDENELLDLVSGKRTEPIFVCRMKQDVAETIGALTTSVWLSPDTRDKQSAKHNDHYLRLCTLAPTIISSKYVRILLPHQAHFIHHERRDGKIISYRAVVKSTKAGTEIYLISVHRMRRSDVRATYKKTISLEAAKRKRREVGPPTNPT